LNDSFGKNSEKDSFKVISSHWIVNHSLAIESALDKPYVVWSGKTITFLPNSLNGIVELFKQNRPVRPNSS